MRASFFFCKIEQIDGSAGDARIISCARMVLALRFLSDRNVAIVA
jgi:hypothetical protein